MLEAPTDTTMIDLGNAYLAAGRIDDATRSFRSALHLDPTRTDVLVFLGALLSEHGHPDQAVPYLEQAVAREPNVGIDEAILALAYGARTFRRRSPASHHAGSARRQR